MLELKNITKEYHVAGEVVHALKGVSVNFRKNEFVSVLGPSGCGKTTLLNIIGGLDKYTSGDLVIEGKSTKQYGDRDWDTYRNHSIGFIFQSYHLIPHQTILQNVEMALTIAGVSKEERRQRAIAALEEVGLKSKMKNRPNQLSGGQAQRVAIARALINDPEIVLADEPTGALDSVTSVQIMDLLKDIAKDRLVIMVTHNPELAEQYSTRIINLKDGEVTGDSMPFDGVEQAPQAEEGEQPSQPAKKNKGKKHSAMSIGMAMGLSVKNLLSKRKRTAMVSVAGSIGIIGVSMVLAISAGVQGYINGMENDMLSGYPVSITQQAFDFSSLMSLSNINVVDYVDDGKVHVESLLDTLGTFSQGFEKTNHIDGDYINYLSTIPADYCNIVQYSYAFNLTNNIYTDFKISKDDATFASRFKEGEYKEEYKNSNKLSVTAIRRMYQSVLEKVPEYSRFGSMISSVKTFGEVPDNFDYVMSQYDVLAVDREGEVVTSGVTSEEVKKLFNDKSTMLMVLNNGSIDDLTLAQYGYFTQDDFLNYAYRGIGDKETGAVKTEGTLVGEDGIPYSDFVGNAATMMKFTYYPNDCVYTLVKVPTLSEEEIKADLIATYQMPEAAAAMMASSFVTRREGGNEQFKDYLQSPAVKGMLMMSIDNEMVVNIMLDSFYESYRIHTADEQSFVANAYTGEYTSGDLTLKAFKDKPGYENRVELGVKLILQKKRDISYGCLTSGIYYTHALTDYVLNLESNSTAEENIVNYIDKNGDLTSVPLNQDYFYVDTVDGVRYYVHDLVPAKFSGIETGSTSMTDIISSVTGSGSGGLTKALFAGDDTPTGIYFYAVDFNFKNKICAALDEWNKTCEGGGLLNYADSTLQNSVSLGGGAEYVGGAAVLANGAKIADGKITLADGTHIEDGKVTLPDGKTKITTLPYVCADGTKVEEGKVTVSGGAVLEGGKLTLEGGAVIEGGKLTLADGTQYKLLTQAEKITYADTVGMIISMINTMIKMITIALVSFTALSLVVSTVMIGIITYVSVVERVKEIGILRAVGARKKDIKRLFNAETLIIGLTAGAFGILVTYLLSLLINVIVLAAAGFWGIAALPWWQAVIMVCLSVALTLISGLIPASAAAKKDPVVALRTE